MFVLDYYYYLRQHRASDCSFSLTVLLLSRTVGFPFRNHLEGKLKVYNQFYEGKSGIVQSRLRNGRLILEGSIRIYWGVNRVIRLKEDHDDRIPVRRRRTSLRLSRLAINSKGRGHAQNGSPEKEVAASLENGAQDKNGSLRTSTSSDNVFAEAQLSGLQDLESEASGNLSEIGRNYCTLPNPNKHSLSDLLAGNGVQPVCEDANGFDGVTLRSKSRSSRVKLRRRCSINGHFYNREVRSHAACCSRAFPKVHSVGS